MASGSGGEGSSNQDIPRGLINRTGNPIGRGSRLPSVRGHRDLTLGGVQRKVYTPNLAAVKKAASKDDLSKSEVLAPGPSSVEKLDVGQGKRSGKSDRGRGRGRGRGKGEDRTIQLHSQFEQGPMGKGLRSWGGRGGNGGGSGGGSRSAGVESDPTVAKALIRRARDTEEDKQILEKLMRDDFVSNLSAGDPKMAPIRLPLHLNMEAKSEVKAEVKEEVMDVDEVDHTTIDSKPNLTEGSQFRSFLRAPPPPVTIEGIFKDSSKSEHGELLFIQFPDTLPGLSAAEPTDDKSRASNSSGNTEAELAERLGACQLRDCNEGYMGKLRIRKSGRAQLVLGDNVMDVLPGMPINFHQELVSIRTDTSPGQMLVLGQVRHKIVVSPDYGSLIKTGQQF